MMNPFKKRDFKKPVQLSAREENCRIRIRNNNGKKDIEFKGKCSKEQIEMAKRTSNLSEDDSEE